MGATLTYKLQKFMGSAHTRRGLVPSPPPSDEPNKKPRRFPFGACLGYDSRR